MTTGSSRWHPLVLETVPSHLLDDLARYIDSGNIHSTMWVVRQVLQFNLRKITDFGDEEDVAVMGFLLRAVYAHAPMDSYGSEKATLAWQGLRPW
ncbi:hypothetical protein [Deinococcus yunweiensis]|uniref:hypothetical protein n=1 Tax=Deinococcus yunweiensis TaxID=367282 RepID=UPI00398E5126